MTNRSPTMPPASESTDDGQPYRTPEQEIWTVLGEAGDKLQVGPEGHTPNRARAKQAQGKTVHIDGHPVGTLDHTGRVEIRQEYQNPNLGKYIDIASLKKKECLADSALDPGADLYKTAEDEEGVYLLTTRPDGFSHQSAAIEEADADDDAEAEAEASDQHAEADQSPLDRAVRLPPDADVSDIQGGEVYAAQVNNAEVSYGVFVSIPDQSTPNPVSGLVLNKFVDNQSDLERLRRGDQILVAPVTRRVTDGKLAFTVVEAVSTMNRVQFDGEAPDEITLVDGDNNPVPSPQVVDDRDLELDAGLELSIDHSSPLSASPYADRTGRQGGQATADADAGQDPADDPAADDGGQEAAPAADGGTATATAAAEAPIEADDGAEDDAVTRNCVELLRIYLEIRDGADAAELVKHLIGDLEEGEIRQFVGLAADSDLDDEVFRQVVADLV